jgi:hypothetical protein
MVSMTLHERDLLKLLNNTVVYNWCVRNYWSLTDIELIKKIRTITDVEFHEDYHV